MQPLAEIGVGHLAQAGAGGGLLLLHGGLGREAAVDVLFHPAQPGAGIGEHAVGLEHLAVLLVAGVGAVEHVVDGEAQLVHRLAQARRSSSGSSAMGLVTTTRGSCSQTRPSAAPSWPTTPRKMAGRLCRARQRRALADEGAELGHLGQHHRHDLERVDLVVGEFARFLGLHDEHAERSPRRWIGTPRKDE